MCRNQAALLKQAETKAENDDPQELQKQCAATTWCSILYHNRIVTGIADGTHHSPCHIGANPTVQHWVHEIKLLQSMPAKHCWGCHPCCVCSHSCRQHCNVLKQLLCKELLHHHIRCQHSRSREHCHNTPQGGNKFWREVGSAAAAGAGVRPLEGICATVEAGPEKAAGAGGGGRQGPMPVALLRLHGLLADGCDDLPRNEYAAPDADHDEHDDARQQRPYEGVGVLWQCDQ
mmetsp:Transcript_1392/g.4143  ORF Transcript_1392/g.4143 Transcript_1392/m.4143 type:complete len:232 (-) Transcript_1392:492-1187(-)